MAPLDPAVLAGAHFILGLVGFSTGQFPAARELFERAVELFEAGSPRNVGASFIAFAPGAAPMMLVPVLVILGYPLTALRRVNEMLQAERRSSDPYNAPIADLILHLLLRDSGMIPARAAELLSIATEHENIFTLNLAVFLRGWATAATGRFEEGITEMQRSISDPAFSQAVAAALALVALAETCGNNGRVEQGLDLVDQGLTNAKRIGQSVAEAELHRLKGQLLLIKDPGNAPEAERCFRTAIDVARRQAARLFELRATVSLARVLNQQGRRDEARQILAEIYSWFTEGFDTADLKEAKALLDELNS